MRRETLLRRTGTVATTVTETAPVLRRITSGRSAPGHEAIFSTRQSLAGQAATVACFGVCFGRSLAIAT